MRKLLLLIMLYSGAVSAQDMEKITYVRADWCIPCETFGPMLKELAEERNIEVEVVDFTNIRKDKDLIPLFVSIFPDGKANLPHTIYVVDKDTIGVVKGSTIPLTKEWIVDKLGL